MGLGMWCGRSLGGGGLCSGEGCACMIVLGRKKGVFS